MSQPAKSTIFAPREIWESYSGVLSVITPSLLAGSITNGPIFSWAHPSVLKPERLDGCFHLYPLGECFGITLQSRQGFAVLLPERFRAVAPSVPLVDRGVSHRAYRRRSKYTLRIVLLPSYQAACLKMTEIKAIFFELKTCTERKSLIKKRRGIRGPRLNHQRRMEEERNHLLEIFK